MSRKLEAFELYLKALCLEPSIEGNILKISPVSEDKIMSWSYGKVTKPLTLNYGTLKPENGGLFAEEIFGPIRDWECSCGKYRRLKYREIKCDKCGVEVASSYVRNERMGHINLSSPVVHPYFQHYMADLLKISLEDLQKIIYNKEENEDNIDTLKETLEKENKGSWMIMKTIPVLPPGLRPVVYMEEHNYLAGSALNDLYRLVILRNNRLKNLKELHAPKAVVKNEQQMLQKSIDALFFNGYYGRAVVGADNEPLTSLTGELKCLLKYFWRGFCNFSAKGIAISDSSLNTNECGVPAKVLLQLYEPLLINKLREKGLAHTIKSSKRTIEVGGSYIVELLKGVIHSRPLLITYASKASSLNPKVKDNEAIALHPDMCKDLNIKIQGEKVALHLPMSKKAVEEAYSLLGKVVEGDGKISGVFSSLTSEDSIEPLVNSVIKGEALQLSELEEYLVTTEAKAI